MEDFLNQLHKTKQCFEQRNLDELMKLTNDDKRLVCIEDKIKLAKLVFSNKLNTYNLIDERISILKERKKSELDSRRKFIDSL